MCNAITVFSPDACAYISTGRKYELITKYGLNYQVPYNIIIILAYSNKIIAQYELIIILCQVSLIRREYGTIATSFDVSDNLHVQLRAVLKVASCYLL